MAAGVPEAVEFATKPELARRMLERALDGGVPCAWVAGDEVYGGDRRLRVWLESRGQAFVMAVAKDEPLWWQGRQYKRADEIAQGLPTQSWRKYSAGAGAKGERLYDWALAPRWRLQMTAQERRFGHYLLVRRSLDEKRELAYYVVYAPRSQATRQVLAKVAGRRWEIECGFEAAKGDCGLDQYEVRRWQGWYRHITLALLAHAALAVLRAGQKKTPAGLIALSLQEIRRLLCGLAWRARQSIEQVLAWSRWRRAHQWRAQQCHYRARGCAPPFCATAVVLRRNIMSIQAINVRNQFRGQIKEIIRGDVLSEIDVETPSGIVTSVITTRAVDNLGLKVGSEVVALVKATEVSIAKL